MSVGLNTSAMAMPSGWMCDLHRTSCNFVNCDFYFYFLLLDWVRILDFKSVFEFCWFLWDYPMIHTCAFRQNFCSVCVYVCLC
jgi:hypothetical protein